MLYLVLSIICSVTVGVLFKIARKNIRSTTQIVASNYVFALILCYFSLQPDFTELQSDAPWMIYAALGILLPTVFLFLVASIKHMGIVKTDAAQRLSLFIPILAAWFLFKEDFSVIKIIAFLIGFPALLLILAKPSENTKNKWEYPVVVFIGFGVIDILFKQIASYTTLPYTTSLFFVFGIAMCIMFFVVAYEIVFRKVKIYPKSILFGTLVGIVNFGNILFYLKAHKEFAQNPSTVFGGMNMGVIIIGSVVGVLVFKEKLSKWNYLGLLFALLAIVLITVSQTV
nr:DMT family transporter [uncultured Flavobacterium sp.]